MRKLILLIIVALSTNFTNAQITLEHTYSVSTIGINVIQLASSGYKYYCIDTNKVKFYNLDHSIWKIININVPEGSNANQINNISETLFNTDDLIELSYTFTTPTPAGYLYNINVINENGTILLHIPNGYYANVFSTGSNGYKLIATLFDNSTNPPTITNQIYSLVGSLPSDVKTSNEELILENAFPNPCKKFITIPYSLPSKNYRAELIIYNINGMEIQRFSIDGNFNNLIVNTSSFGHGTYIYKVITEKGIFITNKFIVD